MYTEWRGRAVHMGGLEMLKISKCGSQKCINSIDMGYIYCRATLIPGLDKIPLEQSKYKNLANILAVVRRFFSFFHAS